MQTRILSLFFIFALGFLFVCDGASRGPTVSVSGWCQPQLARDNIVIRTAGTSPLQAEVCA